MIAIKNIYKQNFDEIEIDEYWNTGDKKEALMHRIHAYPAKFPAFITTKAISYAQENGVKVNSIADIFCGCGTTAYEAKRDNISFWGSDINPVATLIARVKSKKHDSKKLAIYFNKIIDELSRQKVSKKLIANTNHRIKYWFFDEQILDLYKLKISIFKSISPKSFYRDFFLCAFSNILKPTSKWLTKSIKPQIDPNKKLINVLTAFITQFNLMNKANKESDNLSNAKSEIHTLNILNININETLADMVITSPPYVTSYEYADLHQLSSLWLDFTDDYKKLRKGSIGSLYHDDTFKEDLKEINKTGEKVVWQLYDAEKKKAKSTAKYFIDMQKTAKKTYSILNKNGIALFVIGNTEFKGVRIDNAKHLAESLLNAGFNNIKVTRRKISGKILTPYRDNKGKFTTDSNSRKVYAEEFIVVGRKS
ncbi:MAG: class I SAM-dependent methyltransferase [Candidatus Anammoxibacter sp.]